MRREKSAPVSKGEEVSDRETRLRARLRRVLERPATSRLAGGVPVLEDRRLAATPPRPVTDDGDLLCWRDVFDDENWVTSDAPRLFGDVDGPRSMRRALERAGLPLEQLVFVDLETCGLADDPVFLAGTLWIDGGTWALTQWLAADPSREARLMERVAAVLASRRHWISFNGRSFDIARLRRRCRTHGIVFPECEEHRDLLHEVRRRWKRRLPNCRLTTVEERLIGLQRGPGDVPGREVPDRYYDFVQSGERRWLQPVVEHNRRDVAALAALLLLLVRPTPSAAAEEPPPRR